MIDTSSSKADEVIQARQIVYRGLDLVQSDPERARGLTAGFIDHPDAEVMSVALWAAGRANYERAEFAMAESYLSRGLARAKRANLIDVAAQIRVSLAALYVELGQSDRALRELDRAASEISEQLVGRVLKQRSFVLFQLGRSQEAVSTADRALPHLRRENDQVGEARLLINRGIAHLALDDLSRAEADFRSCRDLAVQIDQDLIVAAADHNLAFLFGRRGDVAGALRLYEQARAGYRRVGDPGRVMPILDADMSETLLSAGLAADAANSASRSLDNALASGDVLQQAEASLRLARALLASDDAAAANLHAREAARLCRKARRRPWQALAEFVILQSELARSPHAKKPEALLVRAERLLGVLDAEGWRREAALLRIGVGRVAAEAGQIERAQRHLAAAQGRGTSSIDRLHTWHAIALSRQLAGDPGGAARAARRGLVELADYRSSLGSTELRVSASTLAAQLVEIGVRVAIARRQPRNMVRWAEELRAASVRRSVPPSRDPIFESLLDQHRGLAATRQTGDAGDSLTQAETALADRARQSPGTHAATRSSAVAPQLKGLSEILAGHTLVSFGQCDGTVYASVLAGRTWRLHTIGPAQLITAEIAYLRSAARRLLSGYDAGSAVSDGLKHAAAAVGHLVLDPLRIPPGRPVVLVPSGPLYGLPWGFLPTLCDVAHVVAPSVASWRAIAESPMAAGPIRTSIVVGPSLEGGQAEARALISRHADTAVLDGPAASVGNALRALSSANLVHLAAHGTFRGDSPLLSAFHLHDGPLTVYEIEQLDAVPDVMILPSCEAGRISTHPGDDVMGVAAALVGRGVKSVLAPLDSVPDDALAEPMRRLHERIRSAQPTAEALRDERLDWPPDSIERAAVSSFVCIGASVRLPTDARSG